MRTFRNIIILALITCLSQVAFANPEVARAAFARILDGYEAVDSYEATIGVELEGIFKGQTREEAFKQVEDIIITKIAPVIHPGAKVTAEPYSFLTAKGEQRFGTKVIFKKGRSKIVWEVKEDRSIIPTKRGYVGVEVVSPILRNESDRAGSKTLIDILKQNGFKAEEASAALQVHAGMSLDGKKVPKDGITDKEMVAQTYALIWFFSKIEKALIKHYDVHPDRAYFAKPTPEDIISQLSSGQFDLDRTNLNEFIEANYDYKYWALNVRALFRFGTFEIRFMNSTTDTAKISQLMELGQAVASAVKTKNPAFIQLMNDHIESDITIEELVNALELTEMAKSLSPKSNTIRTCNAVVLGTAI